MRSLFVNLFICLFVCLSVCCVNVLIAPFFGLPSCQVKDTVVGGNGGDCYQRAAKVLSAVEKHITVMPNSIDSFLDVLRAHEISRPLANKILEEGGSGE